jgi:hypothetical protein
MDAAFPIRNIGLDSIARRRVLALLLDIPPAALGIITLEEILLQQHQDIPTMPLAGARREKEGIFDLAVYENRLKTLWNRNHTNTAQDRLTQIAAAMADLTCELPYVSGNDEKEVHALLCRYHHLHAHILRDQGRYDAAIVELEKAAILAERVEKLPLLAVTLLRIGSVLRDRGTVIEAQAKIWEPLPDWWIIGGRMRKGELIEQALRRNLRRELHLDIDEDRLRNIIGYCQIWDTRAWEPTANGCHVFSITTAVHLTDEEKASIQLNEEYVASQWVDSVHVIENADQFHPCLVQVARDIVG